MTKTKTTGNPATAKPDTRPEPSAREKEAIRLAAGRDVARRRPVAIKREKGTTTVKAPYCDDQGHLLRMLDCFGTTSGAALETMLTSVEYVTRGRGTQDDGSNTNFNYGLAFMEAVRPQNELESALAIQMMGSSVLATEMLGRARNTDRTDHIQVYGTMAVKLQRVFIDQLTALAKLRGGGQQTVSVTHTHIDARGSQNVIADSVTTGGGAQTENGGRPHAQALTYEPGAPVPPVLRQDTIREPLPSPCDQGQG